MNINNEIKKNLDVNKTDARKWLNFEESGKEVIKSLIDRFENGWINCE